MKMHNENIISSEKNNNYYREMFYKMEEGFCILKVIFDENEKPVDYVFMEINPAFEKQTGLSNVQGKTMRELVPEGEDFWYEKFGKVALSGESTNFQDHVEYLNRWYNVNAFSIGKIENRQIAVLFKDISESKELELTLEKNQKLLQSTMDNFPSVIAFKDRQGRFINVNHAVVMALGMTKEKIIGLSDYDLFPEEMADKFRKHDLSVMEACQPFQREEVTKLPDGKILQHLDISFPLTDPDGEVYGVGHISHDITEFKRLNRDLEQFAFVASHDLKEPIRMIGSYSQLLLKQYKHLLDPKAEKYLSFVFEGAVRLQALVSDLLNYSKTATQNVPFTSVDLNSVLESAIKELKSEIKKTRSNISFSPMPAIYGDSGQLQKLFYHLLSNAVKFRGDEIPDIRISCREDEHEFIFCISDNGIGIKPEHFEMIFVLFQRLNDRSKFPGTGIGLALSKRIVERHGGRIWVESEKGKGAAFYFSIPKTQEKEK